MKPARHHFLAALLLLPSSLPSQNLDSLVVHSLQFAQEQLNNTAYEVGDSTRFPRSTLPDGTWERKDPGSWTTGFFPGCLWYMYEWTVEDIWRRWAEAWTSGMEREKYHTSTHNVGFMMMTSFGNGYRLTQNPVYKEVILEGARSMATRYNSTVGAIRARNDYNFPVIIDNMMTIELLFWASLEGGNPEWHNMAVNHALKTRENNVREDGSTFQLVDYNPTTADIISRETRQGYSDESTWARGQAWGLYGFTMSYRYTNDLRFLETAQMLADYFLDNLPEDHVPYWDFNAPDIPNEKKEASAAAIAASALLELMQYSSNTDDRERYQQAAFDILMSLSSPAYLAEGTNSHGILLHSNGNVNKNWEVDVSMIYADYYFIEALLRYLGAAQAVSVFDNQSRAIPMILQLFQNYPNPFNSETTISYNLRVDTDINLSVYDVLGRLVHTLIEGFQEKGYYQVHFNGKHLSSGVYFVVLRAENNQATQKTILIR